MFQTPEHRGSGDDVSASTPALARGGNATDAECPRNWHANVTQMLWTERRTERKEARRAALSEVVH